MFELVDVFDGDGDELAGGDVAEVCCEDFGGVVFEEDGGLSGCDGGLVCAFCGGFGLDGGGDCFGADVGGEGGCGAGFVEGEGVFCGVEGSGGGGVVEDLGEGVGGG